MRTAEPAPRGMEVATEETTSTEVCGLAARPGNEELRKQLLLMGRLLILCNGTRPYAGKAITE